MKKIMITFISLGLLSFNQLAIAQTNSMEKRYQPKDEMRINTVSGNCIIKESKTNEIVIILDYTYPDDCFDYSIEERNGYIALKENFKGRRCKGDSNWTILIPKNTTIEYNTASGSVSIEGVNSRSNISTASGDIHIKNVDSDVLKARTASGDIWVENANAHFSMSTASGDITFNKCMGHIELSSASGTIKANGIDVTSSSKISTASGSINVLLASQLKSDLTLSSASGSVELNLNGYKPKGTYTFTAKANKGEIVSPWKFDSETQITKNNDLYNVKSFTLGDNLPVVNLKTASGKCSLTK
ncbi:MAG: DUF4097 family beta strand repeat-containing protein [Tenuifilaceae bacterium]|nr:DUF4097 family beta strand repeat-containing protein [Tenuifilaceae bacterium]